GILAAVILNMPMRFFETKVFKKDWKKLNKIKRAISMVIAFIIFAVIIALILFIAIPKISSVVGDLTAMVPGAITTSVDWAMEKFSVSEDIAKQLLDLRAAATSWDSLFGYIIQNIPDYNAVSTSAINIVKGALDSITEIAVAAFFAIYALMQKESIIGFFRKMSKTYLSEKHDKSLIHFFEILHKSFEDFVHGQCLECFLVAVIFTVVALIFGFKCSLIIGIVMFILAFIPYVGNVLACGLGAIMTIVMETPARALLFIFLFALVQFLDGYLMYPKVIGMKVKMPSLAVFVTVIIGGSLFGFPGMILSIPLVTTFYILIKERMVEKGIEEPSPMITEVEKIKPDVVVQGPKKRKRK
ncbi:MAG: AI-2E family transporter, partial [Lachnospiraceae bacterium]|nr:AI-2E family transporter [Lachnospiraceae bacterium]